jgi:hypothetical protein
MMTTIGNMTLDELKKVINGTIDERLKRLLGKFELEEFTMFDEPEDKRTWDEVRASVKRNRWTPPTGTPSVVELLREDRDR